MRRWAVAMTIGILGATAWQWSLRADDKAPRHPLGRFEFEVIECFDAKYLGDTPGFHGKNGGLEGIRPHVVLGEPVYRGKEIVGKVTSVVWDRTNGNLSVEFDPAPLARISVGDQVWISIAEPNAAKPTP